MVKVIGKTGTFDKTYRLKPLRFVVVPGFGPHWFQAETVFGTIDVEFDRAAKSKPWKWSCCVAEYCDENEGHADTLDEAKQLATEFYLERIKAAFTVVKGTK